MEPMPTVSTITTPLTLILHFTGPLLSSSVNVSGNGEYLTVKVCIGPPDHPVTPAMVLKSGRVMLGGIMSGMVLNVAVTVTSAVTFVSVLAAVRTPSNRKAGLPKGQTG